MYDMGKYQARRLSDDEMDQECLDCKIGIDEFQPQYSEDGKVFDVDACGICCPGPLM